MHIELHNIQKDRIRVDPNSVLSLLGGSLNEDDSHTANLINEYTRECLRISSPKGGHTRLTAVVPDSNEEIEIEGTRFSTGKIIHNMLGGAEDYAFFAVTAGPEPEELARSLINSGDFLEGYIVDLIASIIVESVADQVQDNVKSSAQKDGLLTTNRYSPGYCSWDVSEQQKLFSLLPAGCCGITLSESSLMHPIKSISGIIGIGTSVKYRTYTCEICSMKECTFRRVGPQ